MTTSIEKVNSEAREVVESSNVELFIRDITPIVDRDPDQPLLGKSEKLTIHGKNVADEYLTTLLGKYDQDYSAVLDALRDVEREVRNDTEAPGNYELLQLVRCMRGKLVYNAHVVYALEHYADEFPEKANVYTFLKEKGQPHKRHYSQSVYRAASVISKEKAEQADFYGVTEADGLELETQMEKRVATLAQQNQVIVETDVGKTGWEKLKGGLRRIGDWFSRNRREVLQAGAVAAVVVAVSVCGHRLEKSPSFVTEQAKVVQPLELNDNPTPVVPETMTLENPVFTTNVEVSQTVPPASVQAWEQGYNETGEEILPPVVDSTSDLEIPQEVPSKEVQDWYQKGSTKNITEFQELANQHEGDAKGTINPEGSDNKIKDIDSKLAEITIGNYPHDGKLNLPEAYIPRDLVDLSETDIKAKLWNGAQNHLISSRALPHLLGFVEECYSLGYKNLFIAHTYRTHYEQAQIYINNPRGAEEAGQSQHQTGHAFDLYLIGTDGKLQKIDNTIISVAKKYGIVHPVPQDTPHFFILSGLLEEASATFIASTLDTVSDPDKATNEIFLASATDLREPDAVVKDVLQPTRTQEAYSNILTKYVSKTEQKAIELAQELDFIGPESPYEHPSNMCGPLAASVLKDLNVLPADFEVNPSKFWLANPKRLDRLLPSGVFTKNVFEQGIDTVDFEWKVGDFVYLQGGDFDHMVTVTRVDELGKVYGISNYKNPDGKFVVDEFLLSDSQDPSAGLFNKWPKQDTGRTGMSAVYVWRPSSSDTVNTANLSDHSESASTQG